MVEPIVQPTSGQEWATHSFHSGDNWSRTRCQARWLSRASPEGTGRPRQAPERQRLKEATRFKNGWFRAALRGVVWVNAFGCGRVGPEERAKRADLEPSPDPTLVSGLVRDCA